jgi:ABC-type multidrug transport system ATPase subunit
VYAVPADIPHDRATFGKDKEKAHDDERFGMPEGQVLEFSGVTKRFGAVTAVSDFSARVEPGRVTAFLGPNGAGKTTTLRILLGLVRATDGTATIGGTPYSKLANPLQTVGAVLEASSFHPGRTAANHLRVYARAARIPNARVDEVLGLVGLADSAGRKVGGFSLGMRQRLGLAYALLGDPGVLVLDEPANGLDPEGIKWMRGFLRQLAREGRTLLVSSHLLTEVQQTVDALVVISRGRLVFQGGLDELADPSEFATVVDSPDRAALSAALAAAAVPFEVLRSGVTVRGLQPAEVGRLAAEAGVGLSALQRKGPALEEVFLELVNGTRVHASAAGVLGTPIVPPDEPAPPTAPDEATADAPSAPDATDDPQAVPPGEPEEPDAAASAESASELAAAPAAPAAGAAGFAVASTGVIDIIAMGDPVDEDETTDAAAEELSGEPEESPDGVDAAAEEPAGEAGDEVDAAAAEDRPEADEPAKAAVWVSDSTGAIQRIDDPAQTPPSDGEALEHEPGAETADPDAAEPTPEDADPDVEAIAAIDEELAADEAAHDEPRPFDEYEKTEADLEADAFFSAFSEPDDLDAADEGPRGDDSPPGEHEPDADTADRSPAREGGEQR